jgi:hypothetical protein
MEDFFVRFTVWWRINVSGDLRLGQFLRFVMTDGPVRKDGR